jgi:hypothetical protein
MVLRLRALFLVAVLFLLGAVILLIAGMVGIQISQKIEFVVFGGGFLVFVPSFLVMRKLQDGYTQKEIREHGWKIALRGAPAWVEKAIKLWGWAVGISFVALMLLPARLRDAMFLRIEVPVYLSFFSGSSAAVAYSALYAERYDLKCFNGHTITVSQKFCPQCGAPAAHPAVRK